MFATNEFYGDSVSLSIGAVARAKAEFLDLACMHASTASHCDGVRQRVFTQDVH